MIKYFFNYVQFKKEVINSLYKLSTLSNSCYSSNLLDLRSFYWHRAFKVKKIDDIKMFCGFVVGIAPSWKKCAKSPSSVQFQMLGELGDKECGKL